MAIRTNSLVAQDRHLTRCVSYLNRRSWLVWGWLLLLISSGTVPVQAAHPFHICIGEMEWNEEAKHWEVAVRLHPSDLQSAVRRVSKSEVSLPEDGKSIPELDAYLQDHFALISVEDSDSISREEQRRLLDLEQIRKDDPDRLSRLKFVGAEHQRGWTWIYLEMTPPKKEQDLVLLHRLLLEDVEGQTNTLVVRRGDHRVSMRFVASEPIQKLPDRE